MKILVVNTMTPFERGPYDDVASQIVQHLKQAGHQSELLRLPFQSEPETRVPSQMLMVRAFELYNADLVITLEFPSFLIRHPHKILWLMSTHCPTKDSQLQDLMKQALSEVCGESKRVFASSQLLQAHLLNEHGYQANYLPPPSDNTDANWAQAIEALLQ